MLRATAAILFVLGTLTFMQAAQARTLHHQHHHQGIQNSSSGLHRVHHHARRLPHLRKHALNRRGFQPAQAVSEIEPSSTVSPGAPQARLVRVALRHMGSRNFTGRRGPWCGFAMNAFAREAGMPTIGSGRAIDWRSYGRPTGARAGAIAVFPHHVGIVTGVVGNKVQIISGNHGGRVGLGLYSMSRVVAFRSS